MQSLSKIDPGFTYNITHDLDKNVTDVVWMVSYMRDNFETFGNNISIDVMKLQVCNAKTFFYITPVVLNEVGKINVVCEGFVISEIHDAYCLILNSIFKMCSGRGKIKFIQYFLMNVNKINIIFNWYE